MRRRRKPINPIAIIGMIVIPLLIFGAYSLVFSSNKAEQLVENFYTYEQQGNFSESWELFHPIMKEKFTQGGYIQDRAHVFIGHFGADTFSYEIAKPTKIKDWKMSKDTEPFKVAHKYLVTTSYKGKYGAFHFIQEVYVVKGEENEWNIVWDYNK
ncbi:hypothetical protein JOC85_003353 [Bacillus mesophilus]|uniref:DUF4878 domain-containing protein n=1 Tax=Bacillus mesophilus TaxID=1808955 RepID=A0A6M0Q915_9BACI|nr:hypothetical protein [Bacillus mesophilus]MBM7662546.1 hypothetical protein [Bacillus mesophilus]NEY72832.1 hypothetical protein [Bacillus mesophilus]